MYIDWAKDGVTGENFIFQARPETVWSHQMEETITQKRVTRHGETNIEGTAIGSDASHDRVRVFKDMYSISSMQPGEIIVFDITDPDWFPAIRIASDVIANRGGLTCHIAIISRELGVPCIVGTKYATEIFETGK